MSRLTVVTDTSCDLPDELLARLSVTVVPLIVRFGEEVYLDTELPRERFWQLAERTPPSTSAPPLGAFLATFQELVQQGAEVLCLTITGRHSNVYSIAWSAAQEFEGKVTVVDSQSLSWGLGWQVVAAAEAAARGEPLETILSIVEGVRSRVSIQLVLDTLSYLRRGGRADRFISVVDKAARALSIKPIIVFSEGEMKLSGLSRTWERGVRRMLGQFVAKMPLEALAVGHTFRRERAEEFADEFARMTGFPAEGIPIFEPSCVIASHAGPGLLAAVGLSKP